MSKRSKVIFTVTSQYLFIQHHNLETEGKIRFTFSEFIASLQQHPHLKHCCRLQAFLLISSSRRLLLFHPAKIFIRHNINTRVWTNRGGNNNLTGARGQLFWLHLWEQRLLQNTKYMISTWEKSVRVPLQICSVKVNSATSRESGIVCYSLLMRSSTESRYVWTPVGAWPGLARYWFCVKTTHTVFFV